MKFSGLLLAGLFILLSVAVRAETTLATLTTDSSAGSVKYQVPGASTFKNLGWMEVVKVPSGTIVKTNSDGIGHLEVFPGGKLVIMPNTTMTIGNLGVDTQGDKISKRSGQINLAIGTLKALLNHRGDNTSPIDFSVKTPTCVAAARGTKYVTVVVDGITYVDVIEGTVNAGGINIGQGDVGYVGTNGKGVITPPDKLPPGVLLAFQAAIAAGQIQNNSTLDTSDSSTQSAHTGP